MKPSDFAKAEPVEKGWSGDKKYHVTDSDGAQYLLRLSPESKGERMRTLHALLGRAAELDVPISRPIDFGVCEGGVYSLQSWVDGEDAEGILPLLPDTEQYVHGLRAGEILRKLHTLPEPAGQEDWENRFNRKLDRKLRGYADCPLKYEGGEAFVRYIAENRKLLRGRPQCFQHGDYHIGNMMLSHGTLTVIDFDRFDFGDPWEEFNRVVWSAQASPLFASGMVNGYFGGRPPLDFWKLLALYISSNTLSSLYWAIPFGESEVATMRRQAAEVLGWYDGMTRAVPRWYSEGFYIQYADGLPYKLGAPFDFGFLGRYGRIFKIFDDQDSGNICFGTEKDGKRCFIKFAGAPTERCSGDPAEAVGRLRAALPVYRELEHPALVRLLGEEGVGGGLALRFRWEDGECMGRMYPAAHKKFLALPSEAKLRVFDDILDFHAYAAKSGYVAIDFYDGCVLYDPEREKTTICDIDLYAKSPQVNRRGRMWGSSRFMSPEEFTLGAELDEVTNVYTMGATAFALFADSRRERESWPLSDGKYRAALRAVSPGRRDRQRSIKEFISEWSED